MIANGQQKSISLTRVEMWCARLYSEAREGAMLALASGDMRQYRILNAAKREWQAALLVVHDLQ